MLVRSLEVTRTMPMIIRTMTTIIITIAVTTMMPFGSHSMFSKPIEHCTKCRCSQAPLGWQWTPFLMVVRCCAGLDSKTNTISDGRTQRPDWPEECWHTHTHTHTHQPILYLLRQNYIGASSVWGTSKVTMILYLVIAKRKGCPSVAIRWGSLQSFPSNDGEKGCPSVAIRWGSLPLPSNDGAKGCPSVAIRWGSLPLPSSPIHHRHHHRDVPLGRNATTALPGFRV